MFRPTLVLALAMVFMGSGCVQSYFDPDTGPFLSVRKEGISHRWKIISNGNPILWLETDQYYYPQVSLIQINEDRNYFGLTPKLSDERRVYAGAMVLYRVEDNEIIELFGSDTLETYPGFIYDLSLDEQLITYVPYDRNKSLDEQKPEIVVYHLEDGVVERYMIPEEIKEVGEVVFSPNQAQLAFAGILNSDFPGRGGVYLLDRTTKEIQEVAWSEEGIYMIDRWELDQSLPSFRLVNFVEPLEAVDK